MCFVASLGFSPVRRIFHFQHFHDSTRFSNCVATPAPCHFGRTAIPRICPSSPPASLTCDPAVPTISPVSSTATNTFTSDNRWPIVSRQHRIEERLGRVPVAIVFESRAGAFPGFQEHHRPSLDVSGMFGSPPPPAHSFTRGIEPRNARPIPQAPYCPHGC